MLKTRQIIALTSTLFLTIAISTISCKKQSLTSNQINDVSVLKTRGINYPELGVQFYETYTGIANNSEIEGL